MGFMQRAREWFKRGEPADLALARIVEAWREGRPLPRPHDYKSFADEGYRANIIVAACIWEIVTSASEPVLRVGRLKKDNTLVDLAPTDQLAQLLARPNPDQSQYDLLEELGTHQQVAGQWYLHKPRDRYGVPVQLWALRPDRMKVIPGPGGIVQGYEYTVGINSRTLPAADVVHCKLHPDPLEDFYGLSPLAVAARAVDLDNNSLEFLRMFFLNHGLLSGLLKFKAQKVDPVERARIKGLWKQEHASGPQSWHSVSVLDADVDYQPITTDPAKLKMTPVFDETETRICLAFGVPVAVVQARVAADFQTRANYKEARESFWQETLSPLYRRNADKLTHGVAREFGDDLVIRFDLSGVSALQEDKQAARKFALQAWDSELLTLNEARQLAGFPPVTGPEGDQRKQVSAGQASALAGLLAAAGAAERHSHDHEAHALTAGQRAARARLKKTLATHFNDEGTALVRHLEERLQ